MDAIKEAILSDIPDENTLIQNYQGITVSYIYDYISKKYPDLPHKNWKNTVRHTLSFKQCFKSHRTSHKNGTWTFVQDLNIENTYNRVPPYIGKSKSVYDTDDYISLQKNFLKRYMTTTP